MYQRSTLLIGDATLVTGVQAARFPKAIDGLETAIHKYGWPGFPNWPALNVIHTFGALALAILASGFALAAAIFGIRAIMVERGEEIDVQKFAVNVLQGPADLYTSDWSLVRDELQVHAGDMMRLEARRKLFTRGTAKLAISWSLATLHFALSGG